MLRTVSCKVRPETHVKTFAQTIDLIDDPERIAEYERHHRAVWPEVVRGLLRIGIRRMQLWRVGSRLFMTFQAPDEFDPRHDYQSYAEDPRCAEWDRLMRTYQRRTGLTEPGDDAWWTPMRQIFELEEQPE